MRALIQRVTMSRVSVSDKEISKIGQGFNILLGVFDCDTNEDIEYLAKKIPTLRVFSDEMGKMNLSILDIEGEILLVSQFTLCADTKKGNRPSYIRAAKPLAAMAMYEELAFRLKEAGVRDVKLGVFGADMKVEIINDGPVTIMLDSKAR